MHNIGSEMVLDGFFAPYGVVFDTQHLADRLDELGACRERPSAEVRACTVADHAPILDARGLVELRRADLVGHASLRITEQ